MELHHLVILLYITSIELQNIMQVELNMFRALCYVKGITLSYTIISIELSMLMELCYHNVIEFLQWNGVLPM